MGDKADAGATVGLAEGDLLLGRYRIGERLAEGGHSLVYRVDDERLRRPACAKILNVAGAEERVRRIVEQHFVQEVFLLARLSHASTVQIYDFGYLANPAADGAEVPFQICELVGGGPLSRWVKQRGPLAPVEAARMALPLCRTLAEVHAAGLIHRDVKPQNILLSPTTGGRVPKLADFGIAQAAEGSGGDGGNAVLMYSVNWAAPEQLVGEPLGPASDLYSLALVTIFMLTGRLVFMDADPAEAYRLRKYGGEVVANLLEGVELPPEAVAVLLRACSFDAKERVQDSLELARSLEQAFGPLLIEAAAPVTPPGRTPSGRGGAGADTPSEASLPGRRVAADLWSLSTQQPCPAIGGRRMEFARLDPSCDVSPTEEVRIRVSFVPSSAEAPGLHIRALNCFVALGAGRPSSAVTLEAGGQIDFVSIRGESLARATVSFATEGPAKNVVTAAESSIVVPRSECAGLVAIDFGAGNTCFLGYVPPDGAL